MRGVVENSAAQHHWLKLRHPDPDSLWTLVGGRRMWERRASSHDFCHVRIGLGAQRLSSRLVPPAIDSTHQLDPVTFGAMKRFVEAHSTVADVPIDSVVRRHESLVRCSGSGTGPWHDLSPGSHAQSEVGVDCAAVVDHSRSDWDWLKWLPHNRHPHAYDDVGSVRLVYPSLAAAKKALAEVSVDQRLMVVVKTEPTASVCRRSTMATSGTADTTTPHRRRQVLAELPSGEEILACRTR